MAEREISIQKRVRAVILFASVTVLFVTAAAFVTYEAIDFRARLVRNLSTLATVIAYTSAAPLAFENKAVAEQILAAIKAQPDIEAAILFDRQGNIFATYPKALPDSLRPGVGEREGPHFRDGGLVLYQPVLQEEQTIGTLYLRSSFHSLYEQFWRYAIIVIGVLLGAFGIAFVLSTFMQKRISGPILALTEAARSITQRGDYSIRATKMTEDEIGTLTEAFNRMLGEIQENQRRLAEQARLLDLSTDAIIVRDMDEHIVYWNRGAEALYGWTRAEALGKIKHELLQTKFPQPRERIIADLHKNGRWEGELINTRRDGVLIYVSTRWVSDLDAQSNLARVLITDNDITARKQAEEEIRRNLDFNSAIMTGMGEGLYTVDSQGLVTYMNPASERLFGWRFDELRGRKMHDMTHHTHPDGTPFLAEECAGLQVVREGRTLIGYEDVFIRKDGTFFDVVYTSSPIRSGGDIVGLVVVFSDVSERKRTQEALIKGERQLRLMAELVPGFLVHVDVEKRYVFVNSGYARFYGYQSPEEIVGRSVREVLGAETFRAIESRLDEALGGHEVAFEFSIDSPRDGRRYLRVAYVPFQDESRKVIGIVGLIIDITENKVFEEVLERQVRDRTAKLQETIGELEAFSYSISHDMRAPLRAMQGYAKALLTDYSHQLDSDAQHYLDRIVRVANRLDLLIQDVLAYSRMAKGEIVLHPVDLERLIDEIISMNLEFQEPRARIILEKPLHRVLGHDAYLTQCITNLLANAVKFVPEGVLPEIHIRSQRLDGKVRLWFEDNGIGIDPLHHERIFQIFGQVYPEKRYGGTGIGLAIVRKAVQRMNGEVGVQSEIDKGSRFWLILNEGKS